MFGVFCAGAQNNTKIQQQFDKAMQYYKLQEYKNAITEIEKLLKKNPEYVDATLLLADVYHEMKSTDAEIKTLESSLQFTQNPLIYYRLAKAYYLVANYESALFNFEKYKQFNGLSEAQKLEVKQNIASCRFAIGWVNNPV